MADSSGGISSAGTLEVNGTLKNTSIGVATGGTLKLDGNLSLPDNATLTLDTNSNINLAFASGNETIGALVINGTTFNTYTVFNAANNYNGYASYFSSSGGGLVVPEPSSVAILMLSSGCLLSRRRRQG